MIQIENLSFSYSKKQPLFDQPNLTLPTGNIYGLLGKNGAGKSTLLKIIAGLLFPNHGKLDVAGLFHSDSEILAEYKPPKGTAVYQLWQVIIWLFWWVLPLLCWVITYLGLKEQEV